MLRIGAVLDGKYKILNEIGRGGMSVVYLAINERANKTWAVKEVRKDAGDGVTAGMGLAAETELLKKLDHPNLPSIVDVIDQGGSLFIVMDYIEGRSLQDLLDAEGAQEADRVIGWAEQLCDVLSYLHDRKPPIIYRDMKPSNIILRPGGELALIDFGTAREYKDSGMDDTVCLGTRGYAAPEQFGGRGQSDGRTDIYNLGATLFHLVTGKGPAETNFIIYPVGSFVPELKGSGLEKLIVKCCQPDPEERFRDCGELMYALQHVHDDDDEAVKSRNRRWLAFLSFSAAALLSLCMGMMFRYFYSASLGAVYETILSRAEEEKTLSARIRGYGEAVEKDPERREGWEAIIRDLRRSVGDVLGTEDVDAVRSCIRSGADRQSNLERLERADKKTYARFNYDLGSILFFYSENGRRGAGGCFRNAMKYRDRLDAEESATAQMMYELSRADEEKEAGSRDWGGGKGYRVYWDILEGMLDGSGSSLEIIEKNTGGIGYPVAVCSEVTSAIYRWLPGFKTQGVSGEEMEKALDLIQIYMEEKFGILRPESVEQDLEYSLEFRELDENMQIRVLAAARAWQEAKKRVSMVYKTGK